MMKPNSNKNVFRACLNWKNASKHLKKALKKRKSAVKGLKNGSKPAKLLKTAKIL